MFCPHSTQFGATNCSGCAPGYYRTPASVDYDDCTKCKVGKFTPFRNQIDCDVCPKGWFTNKTAATSCSHCPVGKYSQQRQNSATMEILPQITADDCKDCPKGRYGDTAGLTLTGTTIQINACKPCESGRWSSVTRRTARLQCTACV